MQAGQRYCAGVNNIFTLALNVVVIVVLLRASAMLLCSFKCNGYLKLVLLCTYNVELD